MTHFAPIHIYHQTALRTETSTQSSFPAQVFLHREVCAQRNFCAQTPLHTEVFTQRRTFLHTDALYKDAFVHINKCAWAFLYAEPLPQRSLAQNSFYTFFLAPKKIDTEKIVHTDCTKKIHTDFFARRNFTQNSFYIAETLPHTSLYGQIFYYYRQMVFTQEVLRTEVLRTEGFTHSIFLTHRRFIHRCLYPEDELHTETCAHSTLLHATNFTQRGFASPS